MNHSFTQKDRENPETKYCDSIHLNSFAELYLKFPNPVPAKLNQADKAITIDPMDKLLSLIEAKRSQLNFIFNYCSKQLRIVAKPGVDNIFLY